MDHKYQDKDLLYSINQFKSEDIKWSSLNELSDVSSATPLSGKERDDYFNYIGGIDEYPEDLIDNEYI